MSKISSSSILAMALVLAMAIAQATTSLWFEGGGYWLDMEIGHADRPVVASITFHAPGDSRGVVLRDSYEVERFDVDLRKLDIEYKGSDPCVKPFTLVVRGEHAVLRTGGVRIESGFSWFM